MTKPYRDWVEGMAAALAQGGRIGPARGLGRSAPAAPGAPKAVLFAPHPDDEVIVGGLPLRLSRECGFAVIDVAVTLGSRRERQGARQCELKAACAALGFGLILPNGAGLERIDEAARQQDPARWAESVAAIATVLEAERPHCVFLPHAQDWNRTHVGVHHLVLEALRHLPGFDCLVVETEFWGAMASPNLLVESSAEDVADLVAALSLHEGEIARNPYHLRLPAWMIDNVRRGAELVGGQGGRAPPFTFATLYRLSRWRDGDLHGVFGGGRIIGTGDDLGPLVRQEDSRWR